MAAVHLEITKPCCPKHGNAIWMSWNNREKRWQCMYGAAVVDLDPFRSERGCGWGVAGERILPACILEGLSIGELTRPEPGPA